ncbi:hypothetical protein CHS0354_028293 [Potamilus streckersoni]|uniref:Nuclear receptor coactivator 4 N-terminal domain-containing protein n=1 Tax=Potamilus streckersoni TaxID=2493646 RepID=A0AAE0VJY4_9BIVA|nr:hypothetical protein CHS0354_028293 [Potamilus streckersoni]
MSAPTSQLGHKIEQLEKAIQNVNNAKRQLSRKNVEVKSQIQTNMSRQLETLRNREVWLLNQVDMVTGAKEECLQQQQARLNKALGILQSGIVYPEQGDILYNWERKLQLLEVDDLQPEESPFISFKADSKGLREVIMNYGKVVDSPAGIKTSFMEPNRPSLSLPPHLEEYEDAQHHVLYKTLEEINRSKTKEPYVNVHLPKLSPRLEDWLAVPSTVTTPSNNKHKLSLPDFSKKTSDWLKQPFTMDTVPTVTSISSDVSIQTWLHKIKQDPCEEQEEDFEMIEEQAEWSSGLGSNDKKSCLSSPSSPSQYWILLKERDAEVARPEQNTSPIAEWLKKIKELPLEEWLLPKKADEKVVQPTSTFENFFQNLNLDHAVWLLPQGGQKKKSCCQGNGGSATLNQSTTCPIVYSHSTSTDPCLAANISHFRKPTDAIRNSDNPWLKTTTSSTISVGSFTLPDKLQKDKDIKSWLLNGHVSDLPTTPLPCNELEKYKAKTKDMCWLKSQQSKSGPEKQDMMDFKFSSKFESPTSVTCSDESIWLTNKEKMSNLNPKASFSNFFDYQNGRETRFWLLHSDEAQMKETNLVKSRTDETTGEKWLYLRQTPAATKQVQTTK